MIDNTKQPVVIVPIITPVTSTGNLDEPAVGRMVEFLIAGGVDGIFVLGTTGESVAVPVSMRQRFVEHVIECVKGRVKVYAGIADLPSGEIDAGNAYFKAGVDGIVARTPVNCSDAGILSFYQSLLDGIHGPLMLYNIPLTTHCSIPLDAVGKLMGHPNLIGIKDSENNGPRIQELLTQFGGRAGFPILIGANPLMVESLKQGADGIVPGLGNIIPEVYKGICHAAHAKDWAEAQRQHLRTEDGVELCQKGRALGPSLAAIKAALSCRGLCAPFALPLSNTFSESEIATLRTEMIRLRFL